MSEHKMVYNGGISFFGLLCLILITLKLLGKISISWFWVLFPITIPVFIVVFVFLFILVLSILASFFKK